MTPKGNTKTPSPPDRNEMSLFVSAARFSALPEVMAFLDKHPQAIDAQATDARGAPSHTALTKAAAFGQKDMVELLLQKGAQVDALGDNKKTALLWAAHHGHLETVRLLLDRGADIHASYNEGITPLVIAAWMGHTQVVELLLDRGAPVDTACTGSGKTPLMLAAGFGRTETVRLLLKRGADVSLACRAGQDALSMALQGRYDDIAEIVGTWEEVLRRRKAVLECAQRAAAEIAENMAQLLNAATIEKLKSRRPRQNPFNRKRQEGK